MQKKTAKGILEIYCGETGAADLMLAIKKKMPIMIYDRNCSGIDPLLYQALKRLGAPVVQNYDMTMERKGTVSGVYCTVFINNSFADEEADMMANKTITALDRVGSEAKNTVDAVAIVLSVKRKQEILEALDKLQELTRYLR